MAWEEKPLADAQALRIIKQKSTGTGFEMNNHKAASGIEPSIGHTVDEEARLKTSISGKGKSHERTKEKAHQTPQASRLQREIEKELRTRFSPGALQEIAVRGTGLRAAVQRIGRALGHRVAFVQSITDEKIMYAEGHVLGSDIFIKSDTAEPHLVLLGHELTHKPKSQAPALYAELEAVVKGESAARTS